MPYTHTTLAAALSALSLRLADPNDVYWTAPEKTAYIVEALRTWQALTSFYRDRQTFNTIANVSFYNLTTILPAGVFDYNITDRQQIAVMLYQLLERQLVANAWNGTEQFNLPQVVGALERRRDQFLADSGCVISRSLIVSAPNPSGRIPLPEGISDIRRAAWANGANPQVFSQIWRDDEFAINAYKSAWRQNPEDPPLAYSVSLTPPVSLQLAPILLNAGQIELLINQAGPPLDVTAGVLLSVPDDFAWGVKWGALGDLLASDGPGRDVERAQYCELRYKQAVELAQINPSIMETDIGDVPLDSGSIFDMDAYRPNWQNDRGQPDYMGMAGRNLLAFANTPDAIYGVGIDLARNIPVPVLAGDFLQISQDMLDTLLDYAQHIACFKMGGQDFSVTSPLYQNFIRMAGEQNGRIRQAAFYNDALRQPALKMSGEVPRLDVPRTAQYEKTLT